ncbi:protein kinase superfamily protein [Artemisia annua]|uniref:Protein kinase superfamily protein n=1 Tax=Artemisia annua TaxID=35608 RepID=A0A2U1QKU1_ARTAN|nr:protein kinase superfamily protein [Artemisia annua]
MTNGGVMILASWLSQAVIEEQTTVLHGLREALNRLFQFTVIALTLSMGDNQYGMLKLKRMPCTSNYQTTNLPSVDVSHNLHRLETQEAYSSCYGRQARVSVLNIEKVMNVLSFTQNQLQKGNKRDCFGAEIGVGLGAEMGLRWVHLGAEMVAEFDHESGRVAYSDAQKQMDEIQKRIVMLTSSIEDTKTKLDKNKLESLKARKLEELHKIRCVLGKPNWTLFPGARNVAQLMNIRYSEVMPVNLADLIPIASLEAINLIKDLIIRIQHDVV